MRHNKARRKLGKTGSHVRCMISNMLKSLILKGRIETTVAKAKVLKRDADKMITLAKKNTIAAKRLASSRLQIRYNPLTQTQVHELKAGKTYFYNEDRKVLKRLFEIKDRFLNRNGGYTRIIKLPVGRVGDNSPKCFIEYIE